MRITVFTGNQPRHLALIEALHRQGHAVTALIEATTLRPGASPDLFASGSVLEAYFQRVRAAETRLFGVSRPLPDGVRVQILRLGDVSGLDRGEVAHALSADVFLLFGCSHVRGWLAETLIQQGAVAVHMGLAPWYRGNSANFWALYDGCPHLVGATLYRIDHRIEAGELLFHALPPWYSDPFDLGMAAVAAMIKGIVAFLPDLKGWQGIAQDLSLQRRDTRRRDFTEAVACEFLDRPAHLGEIVPSSQRRPESGLIRPFFLDRCEPYDDFAKAEFQHR